MWANVFAAEVKNSIATGGPYSDGTDPNQSSGDLIALAEGWATLVEFFIMRQRYGGAWVDGVWRTNINSRLDGFDMNRPPMTRPRGDEDGWFLHGVFWDCLDSTESGGRYIDGSTAALINNIVDSVFISDSREVYPVFRYLTSSTWNACDFGNKLAAGYLSQGTNIENLFDSYGFACVSAPPPPSPTPPSPTPIYPTVPTCPTCPKKLIDVEDCGGLIACP